MDQVAKTAVVAGDIWEMPGFFANEPQPLSRKYEECIAAGRRHFEQFL